MSSSDSEDGHYTKMMRQIGFAREECRKMFLTAPVENYAGNSEKGTTLSTGNLTNDTTKVSAIEVFEDDTILKEILAENSKPTRGRGRGRKKKEISTPPNTVAAPVTTSTQVRSRGRGGKRGRASKNNVTDRLTSNLDFNLQSTANDEIFTTTRSRARNRTVVSNSPYISVEDYAPSVINNERGRDAIQPIQDTSMYPTYSIGNTDEYPDNSDDIALFSEPQMKTAQKNVEILDEDNEPLSVKVRWKSGEISKFLICEHQSFSKIYDYFSIHENVSKDKLLFIYNDKILTCDDTPASINYNIAKIMEGGTVSNSLHKQVMRKPIINGIKIKFQCQIRKKPLEIKIGKDDKVSLALTQCAEQLELPLKKLKFVFDGDIVLDSSTPQEMGLENGDCIDVIILS